jgi:quinol-cytochrome oxidoreductase complex cytochrome b subunit
MDVLDRQIRGSERLSRDKPAKETRGLPGRAEPAIEIAVENLEIEAGNYVIEVLLVSLHRQILLSGVYRTGMERIRSRASAWREAERSDPIMVLTTATWLVWSALAITGIWLFFVYRPTAAQAWDDIFELQTQVEVGINVRRVHRWLQFPALLLPALVLALRALQRDWLRAGIAGLLVILTLIATFTGYLLPWDQLALWSVTVGENMSGYPPLFGDDVRFVLVDGVEVPLSTILRWLFAHTLVIPSAALVGVALMGPLLRRRAARA